MMGLFKRFKKEDKKGLKIVYENKVTKSKVLSWIKEVGIDNFADVLVSLGFNLDDTVYLFDDYGSFNRFNYAINEDKVNIFNTIELDYRKKEFTISSQDEIRGYHVDKPYMLDLVYYQKKVAEDKTFYYRPSENKSLFIIDNDRYELSLEICLDNQDSFLDVDNDRMISKYLINLQFPIVIEEVYKELCRMLKIDESMIKMLDLVVTKSVNKKMPDLVMDEILIQDSRLFRFTKSDNGRKVTIDKNGNWIFEKMDMDSVFTVKYGENSEPRYRYTFNDRTEDKISYFSEEEITLLKEIANMDVEKTRRLVKENFNN